MAGFVLTKSRRILEVDPDEVVDYICDLTDVLTLGDQVLSVSVSTTSTAEFFNCDKNAAPLTIPGYGDVAAGSAVVFWVRNGTLGTSGEVTFTVTTVGGRKIEWAYVVVVKNG